MECTLKPGEYKRDGVLYCTLHLIVSPKREVTLSFLEPLEVYFFSFMNLGMVRSLE